MSTSNDIPMTINGKLALDQELEQLIKVDREQIKIAIAEARAHGDLKENAEYSSAKEKQSRIEGRILEIQGKLARAKVIDVKQITGTKIVFGATIHLVNQETEQTFIYHIVGEDESDSTAGKISYSSPIARALIGKEEGDEVVVKAPKGEIIYEVLQISYAR